MLSLSLLLFASVAAGHTYNFSSDPHTRALFFVSNLDPEALANGMTMVKLTDAQQHVLLLKPEDVSPVPNLAVVLQLTVRLPDELADGGDMTVRVLADGVASNSARCQLKAAS